MKREVNIFEVLIIYICTVSLVNVILLATNLFYPLISVLGVLVLLIVGLVIFKIKIRFKDTRFHWIFLVILVIGLALRLSPNLYLTGGQDQGTYVSMSQQYEVNHGLYIIDEFRQSLTEDLKITYDKATTFLGINLIDDSTSKYVIPFYPVLPSWLAIGGTLLGSDNRVYALTLFSLLSITATYLFAYEVSNKNKKVALLASFLIAINPAHVYFSRVPLTEVISMTMFFLSFYYLLKFFKEYKDGVENKWNLAISLLTITVLFYTRMSALLYLPIILLIPLALMLFNKDNKLRKKLLIYCGLWIGSLVISYLFYLLFLPDLYHLIMDKSFFGIQVEWFLMALMGLYLMVLWLFRKEKIVSAIKMFWIKNSKYIYILVIGVLVGLIGYELISYAYNTFVINSNTLFSDLSISNFKQLNFLATFLLISPFLFVLLPFGVFHFRKQLGNEIGITLLILLLSIFVIFCWGVLTGVPYYYYFTRYQLSELIPLCIVFVSWYLVDIFKTKGMKVLVGGIVLLSVLYSGYFSILQLRNYEGLNRQELQEVKTQVGEDDILVVVREGFKAYNQVVFPIKYYFDIPIMQIKFSRNLENPGVQELRSKYKNVYVLVENLGYDIEGMIKLETIEFDNNYFVHCNRNEDAFFTMEGHSKDVPLCRYIIIPNRYYYGTTKLDLYIWK
ncbi:glycosyltransferase family 39 protein [Patescibacteria group bacterium]|nr:glycosyltransferase family 39 protein [Patescibacteria group bacterium]